MARVVIDRLPESARRVREIRKKLSEKRVARVRQAELAQMLGVHTITVANWERGRFKPSWDMWKRLLELERAAESTRVDVEALMTARLHHRAALQRERYLRKLAARGIFVEEPGPGAA